MGNTYSLQSAFKYLGVETVLSSDSKQILNAERILLPGVGSFRRAMANLKKSGLDMTLKDAVLRRGIPLLGICLGMQLLGRSSTEDGFTEGLGLLDCPVERFNCECDRSIRIPHVGFNTVFVKEDSFLFRGFSREADFYFTHSYRMTSENESHISGTCFYGETFVASLEKQNIFGTQFHPEKSQSNGLFLLKNFMEWK
jgi:glutamine amidotransferase